MISLYFEIVLDFDFLESKVNILTFLDFEGEFILPYFFKYSKIFLQSMLK